MESLFGGGNFFEGARLLNFFDAPGWALFRGGGAFSRGLALLEEIRFMYFGSQTSTSCKNKSVRTLNVPQA